MKKKLTIVFAAAILTAAIFAGCSDQAQTPLVETVELELETLETEEDTGTWEQASETDAQLTAASVSNTAGTVSGQASAAEAEVPVGQTAAAEAEVPIGQTAAAEAEIPVGQTAAGTEAAVMSGSIPAIPEDQTVTVQTSTLAVTGTFHYAEAYEVLELVNAHRESLGLDALTWDEDLREAAEIRAAEATISWSHTRPNGESWYTVSDLVKGENLAKGYDSAEAVFDAWMASPGHRENIEWEQASTICVSCFEIAAGSYWAMELGY